MDFREMKTFTLSGWLNTCRLKALFNCFSKERVHCVYSDEPGTSQLLFPKLEEKFKHVAKQEFHSLLFYFTGHHGRNNGFKLGDDDEYLTSDTLETMIKEAVEQSGCKRMLVLLDCCEAPDFELKCPCSYYQINSCSMKQATTFPEKEESLMTEFFVQSLKGQSSRDPCLLGRKQDRQCKLCEKFKSDNGFIRIDYLRENVEKHVQEYDKHVNNLKHDIPLHSRGSGWKDAVFAYFIDSLVTFEFIMKHPGASDTHQVVIEQLPVKKEDLEVKLFIAYREKFQLPKLKPEDFSDMLAITFLTGPRHSNKHELKTLEMIEDAWNGKRTLCVNLRDIKSIHNGKVGVFVDLHGANAVFEYLVNDDVNILCQKSQIGSTITVAGSLEEDGARKLLRSVKYFENKPGAGKIKSGLEEQLQEIRDNDNIEKKGKLVFIFPLEDEDGKQITNFYSIHVEKQREANKMQQQMVLRKDPALHVVYKKDAQMHDEQESTTTMEQNSLTQKLPIQIDCPSYIMSGGLPRATTEMNVSRESSRQPYQSVHAVTPTPDSDAWQSEGQNRTEQNIYLCLSQIQNPMLWQGELDLYNSKCIVQMHFITGCQSLVEMALPKQAKHGVVQSIRIGYTTPLEHIQLEEHQKKDDYCMLLVLPIWSDDPDIYRKTRATFTTFINELQKQQMAGVVNVENPTAFVFFIPPSKSSREMLQSNFDANYRLDDTAHLLVIITTR